MPYEVYMTTPQGHKIRHCGKYCCYSAFLDVHDNIPVLGLIYSSWLKGKLKFLVNLHGHIFSSSLVICDTDDTDRVCAELRRLSEPMHQPSQCVQTDIAPERRPAGYTSRPVGGPRPVEVAGDGPAMPKAFIPNRPPPPSATAPDQQAAAVDLQG
jgi:hypothetical protein